MLSWPLRDPHPQVPRAHYRLKAKVFFGALGVDKASYFRKLIHLTLWLWGGLGLDQRVMKIVLKHFFYIYNKSVWKLLVIISHYMNLSRDQDWYPLADVVFSFFREHCYCCLDADRFCPRAASSTVWNLISVINQQSRYQQLHKQYNGAREREGSEMPVMW